MIHVQKSSRENFVIFHTKFPTVRHYYEKITQKIARMIAIDVLLSRISSPPSRTAGDMAGITSGIPRLSHP